MAQNTFTKINTILIGVCILFVVVIVVLAGMVGWNRSSNSSQTSLPVQTEDTSYNQDQVPPGTVIAEISPTPVPPNSFTLANNRVEPFITEIREDQLTIINTMNVPFDIWIKNRVGDVLTQVGAVMANSTIVVPIDLPPGQYQIHFVEEGFTVETVTGNRKGELIRN